MWKYVGGSLIKRLKISLAIALVLPLQMASAHQNQTLRAQSTVHDSNTSIFLPFVRITGQDAGSPSSPPSSAPDEETAPSESCPFSPTTFVVQVAAGPDDVEESSSGDIELESNDLDLGKTNIGLRFLAVDVPQEVDIIDAFIEFTADEADAGSLSLAIRGQAADNPPAFTATAGDVSARPPTNASVTWDAPAFTGAGERYRTPNLAPIVEEITQRGGWTSGNAMAFLVMEASGHRSADSFDGNGPAPLLFIEYCPSSPPAPTPTTTPTPTATFACLDQPGPLEVVTGFHLYGKFEPSTAPNKKFDARGSIFEISPDISWGKIVLRGSSGDTHMCWAGGYVTAALSWHDLDISWDQSKHGFDGSGTFRNTTAVDAHQSNMTWTGLHVFNVHDGIRTSHSDNHWTIQHTWLEYIRDDCVENDNIYSGTIVDSLFDGCYSGISVTDELRPAAAETITLDRVLMRMEPMPYPYKWDTKDDPMLSVPGYAAHFAYGNTFKVEDGNVPDFRITNSVFLHEYDSPKRLFPDKANVAACSNNTIIWLDGPSTAPYYLLSDFPGCFTIITDPSEGKALWQTVVTDWHARHPEVGANRKPANPGQYVWPRY